MNVIFIVVDTLRADRLGCYGYFRNTSPTIDKLAAEGVLFEDYYTSAISTGAAFTCIFTGLPAIRHHFYVTPAGAPNLMNFNDTIPTLPEIVQSNSDYTTVAVDNLINFAGHMKQTVRGFEFYINVTHDGGFPQPEYTAGEANARFLPWLEAYSKEKFFAFLHLWDTHHNPYRAPGFRNHFRQPFGSLDGLPVLKSAAGYEYVPGWGRVGEIVWGISGGYRGEKLIRDIDGGTKGLTQQEKESNTTQDLYDCSIAYLDSQIEQIIDMLRKKDILDKTIIVVTADHGEGLGIHGNWGHGLLYQEVVHIPLILWRPGLLPEGARIKGFAQHVDIAPTLLDLMGIAHEGKTISSHIGAPVFTPGGGVVEVNMEGNSLLPFIRGERERREFIVTEVRRGPSDPGYRSLMAGQWKLIESLAGEKQLYYLEDDPLEKVNLAQNDLSRAETMSKKLKEWVQEHLKDKEKDPMRY